MTVSQELRADLIIIGGGLGDVLQQWLHCKQEKLLF